MTFWVVLNIVEMHNLNPDSIRVKILTHSAEWGGTSAKLLAGDYLSVTELFYGMMLPSGNDAAQSLAIFFGRFLLAIQNKVEP